MEKFSGIMQVKHLAQFYPLLLWGLRHDPRGSKGLRRESLSLFLESEDSVLTEKQKYTA